MFLSSVKRSRRLDASALPIDAADNLEKEQGINLYAYVRADPINFTDPLGLKTPTDDFCELNPDNCDTVTGRRKPVDPFAGIIPLSWSLVDYVPEIIVTGQRNRNRRGDIRDLIKGIRTVVCSLPTISIGGGADFYAIAGGSLGGGLNLDFAKGRFGLSAYTGVGLGVGVDAGPNIGLAPSGGGIVSANLAANVGFALPTPIPGWNLGLSGTYNMLGTDPGFSGGGIGRAGTPLGYGNVGANIGASTPSLYGC